MAVLETDLDARLHFAGGVVLLTNQRMLARAAGGAWQSWPLGATLRLEHTDWAGVGALRLLDGGGLLAQWRFTLGRNPQALALAPAT